MFKTLLETKSDLYRNRKPDPRQFSADEFHLRVLESTIFAEAYADIAELLTLNYEDIIFTEEENEPT